MNGIETLRLVVENLDADPIAEQAVLTFEARTRRPGQKIDDDLSNLVANAVRFGAMFAVGAVSRSIELAAGVDLSGD